jgi:hypothetical protein
MRRSRATCGPPPATAQSERRWIGTSIRTTFEKLIHRAGMFAWPRLFHNLRASCETDLYQRFPAHIVAAWMGRSVAVVAKHYLQLRDVDFGRAANGEGEVQNAVQSGADRKSQKATFLGPALEKPLENRLLSNSVFDSPTRPVTLRGFEPRSQP